MRKGSILLLLLTFISIAVCAQTPLSRSVRPSGSPDTGYSHPPIPPDEAFINQVFHTVVDSAADRYYLFVDAGPCSFVRYDYDEWITYDLRETVPIYTLNELAKNSFFDRKSCSWQQDQLLKAICLSREKIDSLLDPLHDLRSDTATLRMDLTGNHTPPGEMTPSGRRQKKAIARRWAAWVRLPMAAHTVFYFSRPVFTDDGQYAILDMDYRCDDHQCGQGATCLFRRTASGWKLIGKRVRWGV